MPDDFPTIQAAIDKASAGDTVYVRIGTYFINDSDLINIEKPISSWQMLPLIPSLLLAPMFVIMMLCIHHYASENKKVLSQLCFSFALICAAVLSIHYYIQLTVVQQGILNNETAGLWQFAAPNPHSFFRTFAAKGYGFMGIALLCTAPVFRRKI